MIGSTLKELDRLILLFSWSFLYYKLQVRFTVSSVACIDKVMKHH